jgi:pimeloyl-ACP methyl ester carboxylesterase
MSDVEVARVQLRGIEMAYEEHGAGGQPLVLVHGFTGSRDDWREMLPRLAARGRTLAPDLRGHGESSNPGDAESYTFERLAGDLSAFLTAVGVSRCDLLGHSMGGMVALRLALAEPERVASLLLMDTSAEPIPRAARPMFEASAKIARESGMQVLFQVGRAASERQADRPVSFVRSIERMGSEVFWGRIRTKMLAMDPVAYATLGPLLIEDEGVAQRLAEICCPTTVLVGAEDAAFRRPSEGLARNIPGARLVVIDAAAHSPQLENPEAWLAAVLAHLDRSCA